MKSFMMSYIYTYSIKNEKREREREDSNPRPCTSGKNLYITNFIVWNGEMFGQRISFCKWQFSYFSISLLKSIKLPMIDSQIIPACVQTCDFIYSVLLLISSPQTQFLQFIRLEISQIQTQRSMKLLHLLLDIFMQKRSQVHYDMLQGRLHSTAQLSGQEGYSSPLFLPLTSSEINKRV